jgi:hypothetical protein
VDPVVLRTRIAADANYYEHNADVYVVVALGHVESQVLHGENGGRRLRYVAVVQQFTKIGKLQKGKSFEQTVQLKLKPGADPKNVRIVAFVQEPGQADYSERLYGSLQTKKSAVPPVRETNLTVKGSIRTERPSDLHVSSSCSHCHGETGG